MVPTTRKARRPGKLRTADEYFAGQTGVVADTLLALRSLVKATLPTAREGFKWQRLSTATRTATHFATFSPCATMSIWGFSAVHS